MMAVGRLLGRKEGRGMGAASRLDQCVGAGQRPVVTGPDWLVMPAANHLPSVVVLGSVWKDGISRPT